MKMFRTIAAIGLVLSFAAGAAEAADGDYRISLAGRDGAGAHGRVCRATVQGRASTPRLVQRTLDRDGAQVAQAALPTYGARNERAGGCAFFNTTLAAPRGGALEVCQIDRDQSATDCRRLAG